MSNPAPELPKINNPYLLTTGLTKDLEQLLSHAKWSQQRIAELEEEVSRFGNLRFGNGSPQNGAQLQGMIDRQEAPIWLAGKDINVSETVTIPQADGYRIEGTGISRRYIQNTDSGVRGPASRLVWAGEDGGTIMEYKGHGLILNGVTFVGAHYTGSTPSQQAGVGWKCWKELTTLGTGKASLGAVSFIYCDVGVQFGEAGYEDNADNSVIGYLNTEWCGYGLRCTHADAVEIRVQFFRSYFTTNAAIRVDQSSLIKIMDGSFTQAQTVWSVGAGTSNSGYYQMHGVRFDNAFGSTTSRLIVMDGGGAQARFLFAGCFFPGNPNGNYDSTNGLCQLNADDEFYGPSIVTFRDCHNVPSYLKAVGGSGIIILQGCTLGRGPTDSNFSIEDTRADYWTDCKEWDGTPIPDKPYTPTSDPGIAGAHWSDSGTLKVSAGS